MLDLLLMATDDINNHRGGCGYRGNLSIVALAGGIKSNRRAKEGKSG